MRASELLKEFNMRLALLEARAQGLQRIITSLEGLRLVVTRNTAGVCSDADKLDRAICEYLEQKEAAFVEIDNLKASHRDVLTVVERLEPKYQAVLSKRYLAGLSQYEAADSLGLSRRTLRTQEEHALALLDYHLVIKQTIPAQNAY